MNNQEFIQTIMYLIITVFVPVITAYVSKYIQARVNESVSVVENERSRNLIETATETVLNTVVYVNQTYTDNVKKLGKFDKDAQEIAKTMAITTAVTMISAEAKEAIKKCYISFDTWLDTMVEKAVNDVK